MACSRRGCLRATLLVENLLLLTGGVLLLVVGADALVSDGSRATVLVGAPVVQGVAALLAAAGALVVLLALAGAGGALLANRCLTLLFSCVSGLLLVVTLLAAVAAMLVTGPLADSIGAALTGSLAAYGADEHVTRAWDLLQAGFHCCGVGNGLDWARNGSLPAAAVVPRSCCRLLGNGSTAACRLAPTNANSYLSAGCLAAARRLLQHDGWLLGGVVIALTALLIGSTAAGCCLARRKRSHTYVAVPLNPTW